jgi:hypothetical protein
MVLTILVPSAGEESFRHTHLIPDVDGPGTEGGVISLSPEQGDLVRLEIRRVLSADRA